MAVLMSVASVVVAMGSLVGPSHPSLCFAWQGSRTEGWGTVSLLHFGHCPPPPEHCPLSGFDVVLLCRLVECRGGGGVVSAAGRPE